MYLPIPGDSSDEKAAIFTPAVFIERVGGLESLAVEMASIFLYFCIS